MTRILYYYSKERNLTSVFFSVHLLPVFFAQCQNNHLCRKCTDLLFYQKVYRNLKNLLLETLGKREVYNNNEVDPNVKSK